MTKKNAVLIFAGLFLCAAAPSAAQNAGPDGNVAEPAAAVPADPEEKEAENTVGEIEDTARREGGQERIAAKLKTQFGVDDARLLPLRDAGLNHGEISLALALAGSLPGGINDANLQKVASLRQGPPKAGWGKIARDLGLKLGQVLGKTRKLTADLRKEAELKKREKGGKGKKSRQAAEKKGDRPVKGNRPLKSEKPSKGGRGN